MSVVAFAATSAAAAAARPPSRSLRRGRKCSHFASTHTGQCRKYRHNRRDGSSSAVFAARPSAASSTNSDELPPQEWAKEWRASLSIDQLQKFIEASCERLAGVDARFIVIGDGGILESVNPWPGEPRFAELGSKGTCCTLASPNKNFEAHLFLAKVREVALARSERGGRKIYAVRFFGDDAGGDGPARPMLTVVLHGGEEGVFPKAAVDKWESLAAFLV